MKKTLESLREYVLSRKSEDAKRPHAYAFFKELFGKDFKVESDAAGADGYIEGKLLVELKTGGSDWPEGLFQGLHYQKLGLSFPYICVLAFKFVGLWKVSDLPKKALDIASKADSQIAPSQMGRINANKMGKADKLAIRKTSLFLLGEYDISGLFAKDLDIQLGGFVSAIKHLDKARVQINLGNFIDHIERLERFFDKPLDAIHCFFAIVGYWSAASKVVRTGQRDQFQVIDTDSASDPIPIVLRHQEEFKKYVEAHYIFTNEGSAITADNYFSRFDEVISRLDPSYARQHGIFFTDHNLSKFAMWFVHQRFEKKLSENFIVFDPAGGSGNLITSLDWRGHMKHKIVSELQPDLLKVIERRMKVHEKHVGNYTIIPKTVENRGLNFLDKSAADYLAELQKTLEEKAVSLDKPLAFLLNPPYKNTDEDVAAREQVEAEYFIDPSILGITGEDAGRERYLAFLGQILNIAKLQNDEHPGL